MSGTAAVRTIRLRYSGVCAGCSRLLAQGETTAHYLRASRTVRCLPCGSGIDENSPGDVGAVPPSPELPASPSPAPTDPSIVPGRDTELVQGGLPRVGECDDCHRRLKPGSEALFAPSGTVVLCMECVTLDTVHSLGVAGGGARKEHRKRQQRHQTKVRTAHPKLGGLILALRDDPAHVRAWQTGAVGEEEFGRRLSATASGALKVLHDRKVPRSSSNIDHLAVTTADVWVLDAKRYKGKVETRGHGLFSRRPPDLYVGGRNQMKLVEGVMRQAEIVRTVLEPFAAEHSIKELPVRGALVFINADFGLFPAPFAVDGIWIGWGKAIRKRLAEQSTGNLPLGDVAKRLARELRPG